MITRNLHIMAYLLVAALIYGTSAAAETAERLDEKQLKALFSPGLKFEVQKRDRRIYFEFNANGTWDGEARSMAWGKWYVENRKLCRDVSGGDGWRGPHCFGIERRGDDLYYVKSNHHSYEGLELLLDDYTVLSRLDSGKPKPNIAANTPSPAPNPEAGGNKRETPPPKASKPVVENTPTVDTDGFRKLGGTNIQRLFEMIGEVNYPDSGDGFGSAEWLLKFRADGTFEVTQTDVTYTDGIHGLWRVNGDKQCVKITGGDDWYRPYEGCFQIYVNEKAGVVAAKIEKLQLERFVIAENESRLIASLLSQRAKPESATASAPPQPADRPVADAALLARQKAQAEKQAALAKGRRELERQRLALERERLELERQKLEQARRALALRENRNSSSVDTVKPQIDTAASVSTNSGTATISGSVRDNRRLLRVEVGGRRVDFAAGTGRFSAGIPVALGQSRIRVTAIDASGNKAERIVSVTRKRDIPAIDFGAYHAIVIGINDYKSLPKLKTAVADARAVAQVLEKEYGYTVHLLENPSREDIIDKFDDLREILTDTDNLLIYYAGHGWRDPQSGTGYWLPVNAKENRRSRWYSNATLTEALQGLFAKHVMVVADSCYSGTLTRSIKVPDRNPTYIARMAEKRTRVVLSSGGLEPVEDSGGGKHSVFAAQFLKALRDNDGVLDGTQLFERVRHTVVLNANQTPEYSDIRLAGHEGGDFLFVRAD